MGYEVTSRRTVATHRKRDLAGVEVSKAEMCRHAVGSCVVLALLSPSYFDSKWCRAELEAASDAGVPIIPVFAGEHHTYSQILGLNDALRSDSEKRAAVRAAFGENLIDVHNPSHAEDCDRDIRDKIVGRFLL